MSIMSLLSKAEVHFLQGKKVVSRPYEYKIKSIIKKKLSILVDEEIPLVTKLFPNLDLTKLDKIHSKKNFNTLANKHLTNSSKDDKY